MVGLFEFTLANFDDVRQILLHLIEQLPANVAFTMEQPVQRILVISSLFLKAREVLSGSRINKHG